MSVLEAICEYGNGAEQEWGNEIEHINTRVGNRKKQQANIENLRGKAKKEHRQLIFPENVKIYATMMASIDISYTTHDFFFALIEMFEK